MTARSWLIVGLVVVGLLGLLESYQTLVYVAERADLLVGHGLWFAAGLYPMLSLGLILLRVQLAGWILGPVADKPAPLDHHGLVIVVAALLGCLLVMGGFEEMAAVTRWIGFFGPRLASDVAEAVAVDGGLLGYYLREVWLEQFLAFVLVCAARHMPRVMRLPPP